MSNVFDRPKTDGSLLVKWPVVYMSKVRMMYIRGLEQKWLRPRRKRGNIAPSYSVHLNMIHQQQQLELPQ